MSKLTGAKKIARLPCHQVVPATVNPGQSHPEEQANVLLDNRLYQ